jgi:Calcineurin-like phosphoesterase
MWIDVVPDVHGQLAKLDALLAQLGYTHTASGWKAPSSEHRLVFLGDLIDRGPQQRGVVDRVRALEGAGIADRVLGNHEMNALHWVMEHEGGFARAHTPSNQAHHQAFLDAYAGDPAGHLRDLDFLGRARLAHRVGRFVFVHAFWTPTLEDAARFAVEPLEPLPGLEALANTPGFVDAARGGSTPMGKAIDLMTKGPESPLPDGYTIVLEHGIVRRAVRRAWWNPRPIDWRDGSISLPDVWDMPPGVPDPVPGSDAIPDDVSIVFGHYWRRDAQTTGRIPAFHGRFACLDQSAGAGGDEPLVSLRLDSTADGLPVDADGHLLPHALTTVR